MATTNTPLNFQQHETFLKRFGPPGREHTRAEMESILESLAFRPQYAANIDALVSGSIERSARGESEYFIMERKVNGTVRYQLQYDTHGE